MTLILDMQPELEAELRAEAAKAGIDPNTFVLNTLRERLHLQAAHLMPQPSRLSAEEAALLQQINQGLPEEDWKQYAQLVAKRRAETMTPEEHTQLIALSDRIEERNSRRIEYLIKLAQLRQTSLEALMQELGIKPRHV